MSARGELSKALTSLVLERLRETGRYHLPGFGVWTFRYRKARRIKDNAGHWMDLPATPEVRFRAAKQLKAAVSRRRRDDE